MFEAVNKIFDMLYCQSIERRGTNQEYTLDCQPKQYDITAYEQSVSRDREKMCF